MQEPDEQRERWQVLNQLEDSLERPMLVLSQEQRQRLIRETLALPCVGVTTGLVWAFAGILFLLSFGPPALAAETGELGELRARALSLVNDARKRRGLNPLQATERLNSAAQAHAEDMLERSYYSHTSPEGETVSNRYRDRGGSRWKKVAENIARCAGCPTVPTSERVSDFQEGWMNSPGHRQNILAEGLESFGFGIIGENGKQFAVQTFAGPGVPLALRPNEEPVELSPSKQVSAAAHIISTERKREGLAPLKTSEALNTVAQLLLPKDEFGEMIMERPDDLFDLLPAGSVTDWSTIEVVAGECGGCGVQPTRADIRYFIDQWLKHPQNRGTLFGSGATHIGFSMLSNGEGRKIMIAVAGYRSE